MCEVNAEVIPQVIPASPGKTSEKNCADDDRTVKDITTNVNVRLFSMLPGTIDTLYKYPYT